MLLYRGGRAGSNFAGDKGCI